MSNSFSSGEILRLSKPIRIGFCVFPLTILVFQEPIRRLAALAASDEHYTHLLFIPAIVLWLLWLDRERVFRESSPSPRAGAVWIIAGLALGAGAYAHSPERGSGLPSIAIIALILVWLGLFVLLCGAAALRRAWFPAAFLLLFVPMPSDWVKGIEGLLQRLSADLTHILLRIASTPVYRDGLTFSLPGVQIEVAPECSGMRSSIALLIASLLLGHLFFRTATQKVLLVLITLPMMIFKNAFRIAVLSWLGVYVSRDYLTGDLHHRGGLAFLLFAVLLLAPAVLVLERLGRKWPARSVATQAKNR
jgi:exosortase